MMRIEYKYLVPFEKLEDLRNKIFPYLNYDPHTASQPNKEYTVRSIYFDTPSLKSYYEKIVGLKIRNKFRIRGYNSVDENSYTFLEIKRKDAEYVSKDRALLQYKKVNDFLSSSDLAESDFQNGQYRSAKNFLYHFNSYGLKPVVLVVYEREAFTCALGSNLRVTFDKNLRSSLAHSTDMLFSEEKWKRSLVNYFVLEIKYYKVLPYWVPQVINKYKLQREAVSKYTICVDEHRINNKFYPNISL